MGSIAPVMAAEKPEKVEGMKDRGEPDAQRDRGQDQRAVRQLPPQVVHRALDYHDLLAIDWLLGPVRQPLGGALHAALTQHGIEHGEEIQIHGARAGGTHGARA